MVAVRETLGSDWQGDLTEISGSRGYWVHSDAIQDWEVSVPRLAGGADWNRYADTAACDPAVRWLEPDTCDRHQVATALMVETPVKRDDVYLQNLGRRSWSLARVLGFDTIRNQWQTVLDP